jgi:putative phage-type endonuclease
MKRIELNSRAEWLEARQKGLGGSDIAAVLGLSPYRGEWDVFLSKTTPPKKEDEEAPWLERGRYLESGVGQWYADKTGVELEVKDPDKYELYEGEEPWMLGSPDVIVVKPERYGLEIKTSRSTHDWGPSGTDQVPVDYQLQCLWYSKVFDLDRWDVAVLLMMNDSFRRYTLLRDKEVEKHVVDKCREWWDKRIVKGEAPPIDGSGAAGEWLRNRFPKEEGPVRPAFPEEMEITAQLEDVKGTIKQLKLKESELKNRLISSIGDAEGLMWDGGKVTYKAQTRTTIDSKRLRVELPEVAAKYEKINSVRTLRTTLKKTES